MEILIRQAKIIDSKSPFNGLRKDILIRQGIIEKIEDKIDAAPDATIVAEEGLNISPGWVDLYADFQDPGHEQKEDIRSGIESAAAGGFTAVCVASTTQPSRDNKGQIEYLLNLSKGGPVDCLPYACVTKGAQGKELAELFDLASAGAVAFSDGKQPIQNPGLLKNALLYVKGFDGKVFNYPLTQEMASEGIMNEGEVSTALGLVGIPELSESLMVERDIHINEYVNGSLHFHTISSADSLHHIENAKAKNQKVSCDVASYQLLLDDSLLNEFDTRYKTLPPLRSQSTIDALIQGIENGSIDAICSNHIPEDIESKKKELDHAAFGIINLQTAFSAAWTALEGKVSLEKLIDCLSYNPAKVIGLKRPFIGIGNTANCTLFNSTAEFTLTNGMVKSKSKNSPFLNKSLKGKVVGIVNGEKLTLN